MFERVFDPLEEVIQPARQLRELFSGVLRDGEAPAQLPGRSRRDDVGIFDHLLHRRQRGTREEPSRESDQAGEEREPDRERELEPVLRARRLFEGGAHHDHLTLCTHWPRAKPRPFAARAAVTHEGDLMLPGACQVRALDDRVVLQSAGDAATTWPSASIT